MGSLKGYGGLEMFKILADIALSNQELRPGDYINDEGLLCCNVCKEPRQAFYPYQVKIGESEETVPVKVTSFCLCERNAEKKQNEEKRYAENLRRIEKLRRLSIMEEKFSRVTFDTLQVTPHNDRNMKLCKRYAFGFQDMLNKNQGLLMWGGVGTGKSCVAAAIANHLLNERVPVVMTSFVKIVEDVQMKKISDTDLYETLSRADLVIFDDLGAERKTDFALEIVYNAIDDRYRKKLPMIITTNKTLDEMKSVDDIRYIRIYDRIFEVCYPMQFTGPSWRKKMAFQKYGEMEKLLDWGDDDPI